MDHVVSTIKHVAPSIKDVAPPMKRVAPYVAAFVESEGMARVRTWTDADPVCIIDGDKNPVPCVL